MTSLGNSERVAFLGWGEAGSAIGADLIAAGIDVRIFDPKVRPSNLDVRTDEADAVRDATIVVSINSSHDAIPALKHALPALRPGTVWADFNAAAPRTKVALCELAPEASVVDVALMAPVPGRGVGTPIVASGDSAAQLCEFLNGLGADAVVQPGPAGTASSRKLLRSVFYKGLAASVVEALAGAEAAGCADWLRENISHELAGFDADTIDRLVNGTHQHARRRTDEMSAAADQLRDLGIPPRMAQASHDLLASLVADMDR